MDRVSGKTLKRWIDEYNTNSGTDFVLSVYNGYYHLSIGKGGEIIITEKTPGRCWESFGIFNAGRRYESERING